MSLKPCKITVTETGKVYDYEAIKEWLVENEALWKAPAKAEKAPTAPAAEGTGTEGKAPTGLDKLIQDAEQAIKDLKSDSSIGANKPLGILFLQTYIAVLKAAKAAGEVITAAQARLRARKQLIDQGNNPADVDAAMATASETLRKATPPPPPVPPKAPQPEGQEGQVIKAVLGRSYTATTSDKVVKAIQDLGLFRPVVNIKDAFEKGKQLVEKLGFDGAYEVFQDLSKTFEGDGLYLGEDLRLGIFKALGEYLQKKIEKSDDAAQNDFDEKRLAVLQEKAYRLISGAGIRLRVWRDIMENTMVPYSYIKRKREWNTLFPNSPMPVELENKLKEAEARYNELSKKLLELEAKQKEWEESQAVSDIAESIEDENKTTKKPSTSVLKKLAQQVRKLSLTKPRPGMFNAATPASLAWDAAVEAVAKVLDAGGSVEIAVKKGVQVIKESDWYKKLSKAKQAQAEGQFVDYHSEILETKEGMAEVVNGVVEIPHSLIRYYVSEGETDIDVIAEKILDTLKEENPSLTKREVRDAISGYAKKVKRRTQNEINDTINTLKREGKLQSELEDLQRGIKKEKNPRVKKELSDRAKRITEQIEQIHKDIFGYSRRRRRQMSDAERLQAYKDRAKKRIDELKRKIAEKDFSKKEKRPPVDYDAKAKEIEFEKFKLDEEWNDIVQEENKRVNGNALEKFLNIYGMTRWFTVGFDLGVAGIQGFLLSFQDLKATGMALRNAAKAMLLETNYEKIQSEIKNNPRYKLARQSGLDFYNRNDTIANKDDLAAISSASTAFNTFGVFFSKMVGKKGPEFLRIWKNINPFTALERTQAAYMNTIQFAMFNAVADIAEMKGYDFKEDPQVFKDAADITNTFSRRTKMAGLEKNKAFMAAMNVGFFSARNWASLIKLTTPILFYHLGRRRAGADTWNSLSPVQKVALKTYAKAVLSTFAVVLLAKLLGGWDNDELDEEEKKKEGVVSVNIDDARRADWMKIRIGKQTIDPFSGLSQHIILQTRLIADMLFGMRGYVSTETGIEKHLGQDNVPSPLGLVGRMAEGKLQPTTRLLYTSLASRRVKGQPAYIRSMYLTGQEVDLRQEAKEAITNLTIKAGQESYEEQGGFFGTLFTALAIFGFGVSRDQAIEEQSIKRQIQQKLSPDKEKQMWEKAFKSYARENDKEMANKAFEKAVKGEEKYKKAKEIIREVSGDNVPKRYGLKEDDIPLLFERLKTGKAVSSPALNALTIDELDRIRNDYKVQYKELMSLVGIIEAMNIKNKYNERINWTEKVNFTPWVKEYQMAIGGK